MTPRPRSALRARSAVVGLVGILAVGSAALGLPAAAVPPLADDAALGGTPVSGSTDPDRATEVGVGTWTDSLDDSGPRNTKYYRYDRSEQFNDSVVFAGAVTNGPSPAAGIEVEMLDQTGEPCSEDSADRWRDGRQPVGAVATAGRDSFNDQQSPCLNSEWVVIAVGSQEREPVDFSLRVIEENRYVPDVPDAVDSQLPPAIESVAPIPAVDVTPGGPEQAGSQLVTDAPALPDDSFTTTIESGQYALWRVPLTWGQELRAGALVEPSPAYEELYGSVEVTLSILTPALGDLDVPYDTSGSTDSAALSADDQLSLASATGAVRLLNRYGSYGSSLVGDFYLVVSVSATDEGEAPVSVPISVAGEIAGEEEGVPDFPAGRPYLEGSDTGSGADEAAADDSDRSTQRTVGAAALALVGALAILGGIVRLRRR